MNKLLNEMTEKIFENSNKLIVANTENFNASRNYVFGTYKYLNEFNEPFMIAFITPGTSIAVR